MAREFGLSLEEVAGLRLWQYQALIEVIEQSQAQQSGRVSPSSSVTSRAAAKAGRGAEPVMR